MMTTSMSSSCLINKKIIVLSCLCACLCASQAQGKEPLMESPFGVLEFLHWNHQWNNYKYPDSKTIEKTVRLMKKAGIAWVRMDFLWQEIEPAQGEFDFTKYDAIVDIVRAHGLQVLGILQYNTPWASAQWNEPPRETRLFANYAARVVAHYKNKVKYWEVWNEPDSPVYWNEQDGLKGYCALLKEVYIAAKKADPECKILNGGFANGPLSVNRLYDNGAKDYFDILNIHIFENPLRGESLKAAVSYVRLAYKIMSRNGDAHKKIWITEIGAPGVKRGIKTPAWWQGPNPDELQQAAWVKAAFTCLLREKPIERIFWAFFRDCQGHWGNGIDYFGLVHWDHSPKPSFAAYRACVREWLRSR